MYYLVLYVLCMCKRIQGAVNLIIVLTALTSVLAVFLAALTSVH